MNQPTPDRQQLLDMMSNFQAACVLGAAAELDLFTAIGDVSLTAPEIAGSLRADLRGTTILLDAAAALGLLEKRQQRYRVPESLWPLLTAHSPQSILAGIRHRLHVLRGWSQLAWTVRAGFPAPRVPSLRGAIADRNDFIAAMDVYSSPLAEELVGRLLPLSAQHVLDVGGASGTWTLAWLHTLPDARATIFDLPDAIEQARERMAASDVADRVDFVPGDFYRDELPTGADLAWVSAIVHQNTRQQNRNLFTKVRQALEPEGIIAVRDVVMHGNRTEPPAGALFAVNMLVHTEGGGTFTFDELAEDLVDTGFVEPQLRIEDEGMNSVVTATKG